MQEPGDRDTKPVAQRALGLSEFPEPEIGRVIEHLDHEVFPVDVDAPPELGEARGKTIAVIRFRQVEPEQMQHPDDEMKLSGNTKIEQKVRNQVLAEISRRHNLRRVDRKVVVDDAIEDEMVILSPSSDSGLMNFVGGSVVVSPSKSLEVDHGKEGEADIGQEEEIAQSPPR
jgi:hypothetical protein